MGRVRQSTRKHYADQTTQTNALESPIIKKRKVDSEDDSQPHGEDPTSGAAAVNKEDDIIYLNVGGETFTSTRKTLCQIPLLARMLSRPWEGGVEKDGDGKVFLDQNPYCFKLILNYVRSKQLSAPTYPPKKPVPTADEYSNFYILADYLGLIEEIVVPQSEDRFCDEYSSNICLSDDNLVARHLGKTSRDLGIYKTRKNEDDDLLNYVVGGRLYENGCHQWQLKVTSMGDHSSIFIGVQLSESDDLGPDGMYGKDEPIQCSEKVFGWDANSAWQSGKCMSDEIDPVIPIPYIRVGTTHVLTLNLDTMDLSLSNGQKTTSMTVKKIEEIIKDPVNDQCAVWCLCIGFKKGTKNEIRLESN